MKTPIIQKITSIQTQINRFSTIHLLGDPGCDGLGAEIMSVFSRALNIPGAEYSIVLGDLVPTGTEKLYNSVTTFLNQTGGRPVFALCGNHDTNRYEHTFGLRNYLLYNEDVMLLILDNSLRHFSDEVLLFAKSALNEHRNKEIVILFHIPPPNEVWGNHISQEAWAPFAKIVLESGVTPAYYICGHVHNYFESKVDGIPLIVSGGAGARLESIGPQSNNIHMQHHIVELNFSKTGGFSHRFIPLEVANNNCHIDNKTLRANLETAFAGETKAHFMYRYFAEEALSRGDVKEAHLFRALSDAEYYHAKNHFALLENALTTKEMIACSLTGESYEVEQMYPSFLEKSLEQNNGLSYYSMLDALEAEKIHSDLLKTYLATGRLPNTYATCTSCGFTFTTDTPQRCPVCGAPTDKLKPVL